MLAHKLLPSISSIQFWFPVPVYF